MSGESYMVIQSLKQHFKNPESNVMMIELKSFGDQGIQSMFRLLWFDVVVTVDDIL